ncbi:UNVERIFIED_CONTAM: hypothetical protein PYX00_006556 [Menopon gallinae]|uniref:Gustatory receptor n=1 Tax=Menopon gallinae TaxID=328185 RepID=A0AAW2HWM4_9NEOP
MGQKATAENRPKGVYQGISRLLLYCRLMLNNPYGIDKDGRLVVSSWQQVLQTVVSLLICALLLFLAYFGWGRFSLQNPYITLKVLRNLVHAVFWLTYMIESKRQNGSMTRIFERIKTIEDRVAPQEKQLRKFSRKVWSWILVSFGLCAGFTALRLCHVGRDLVEILCAVTDIILIGSPLLWDMPLWMLLTLCVYYIDYVNSELGKTFTEQAFVVSSVSALGPPETDKLDKTRRLSSLRDLFRKIDDLKNEVNDLFANRIWICVLSAFIEIVHFFFFNITLIRYWSVASGSISLSGFTLFNFWKVVNALRLFEVVIVCSRLAEKGQSTSIVVHELFAETVDDQAKNELAIFSLELLHIDVGVSGNGFFTVDYSLLSAVASAAVMYTIVLFQFEFPGYSEDIRPVEDMYDF